MRSSAVRALRAAHFGGFQAFVGHLTLEFHFFIVSQRAETAHLNNALEKPTLRMLFSAQENVNHFLNRSMECRYNSKKANNSLQQ